MRLPVPPAAVYPTGPLPSWLGWVYLAGAIAFALGLVVLLVVIARRSRWDR
jgi:TRAP-type C4-dicarboxylate transport system permease small subunit